MVCLGRTQARHIAGRLFSCACFLSIYSRPSLLAPSFRLSDRPLPFPPLSLAHFPFAYINCFYYT